ncbi:MAG: nucleic acid-binding protein, partial [Gammaproteobacteria bacterium]|nr:nucleic acid-binding protein [Gammaproteobacteria bacterium]
MRKPVPTINEITRPYWEAARENRLLLQICNDCQSLIHYPRRWCPQCWSTDLAHTEVEGKGEVLTFTIVHQGPAAAFTVDASYVLAIITLNQGPTLLSN